MNQPARIPLSAGLVIAADLLLFAWFGREAVAHQSLVNGEIWDNWLRFAAFQYPQQDLVGGWLPGAYAHFRADWVVRVIAFLTLHAWFTVLLAGPVRRHGRRDSSVVAALAAGPPSGVLAGAIGVIPEGLGSGLTVESREAIRSLAVTSMVDGAVWGLVCGVVVAVVCALALAMRAAARVWRVRDLGFDGLSWEWGPTPWRAVIGLAVVGCLVGAVLPTILGRVASAVDGASYLSGALPGESAADVQLVRLLTFASWAPSEGNVFGDPARFLAATVAWSAYALTGVAVCAATAVSLVEGRRRAALREGLAASLLMSAVYLTTSVTSNIFFRFVRYPEEWAGLSRVELLVRLLERVIADCGLRLPEAAAFAATLGWWPFAAMILVSTIRQRFSSQPGG